MNPKLMKPIELQLKPSLLLLGLLTAISTLSCVILSQIPIALSIKSGLIALVIFSTIYFMLRDALLLLPHSWQRLSVTSKGQIRLVNKQGAQILPALVGNTFISHFLIIFLIENSVYRFGLPPLILFRGLENYQQHRQLRIYLRWGYQQVGRLSDMDKQ